jgi:hypothetical protein
MKKISISYTTGDGHLNHNLRKNKQRLPYVDYSKSSLNVKLIGKEDPDYLERCYNSIFGDAVKIFNAKTKRKDRQIKSAYNHFSNLKASTGKRKLFKEIIIQLGTSKDNIPPEKNKMILQDYLKKFRTRNPNLIPIMAMIHNDETSPHLHLDVIPVCKTNNKLGLGNSFKGALNDMGFSKQYMHSYTKWRDQEINALEESMLSFGYEREEMGNTNKHCSTSIHEQEVAKIERETIKKVTSSNNKELDKVVVQVKESTFKSVPKIFASYEEANNLLSLHKENEAILKSENEALKKENKYLKVRDYEQINNKLAKENDKLLEKNQNLTIKNEQLKKENEDGKFYKDAFHFVYGLFQKLRHWLKKNVSLRDYEIFTDDEMESIKYLNNMFDENEQDRD